MLEQARIKHYTASAEPANRERLGRLFNLVQVSIKTRDLLPINQYAQELARERFNGGFEVAEVLAAINVLEESIWHFITGKIPPAEYPEAFGLTNTVFSAAQRSLATEFVSLASKDRVQSIDLSSLFRGT